MATKYNLLVPVDFTEVTEKAVEFALDMAKLHSGNIMLLHVITHPGEKTSANQQMNQLLAKFSTGIGAGIEIETRIVTGKVLKDIGIIADSIGVDLIIMGTHSTSVWQKMVGSPALSVISNSNVPMILIQKNTEFSKIDTIVMTLDLVKESIQVVRSAAKMAKLFNSKIYLVAQKFSDELFMKKITANLHIVRSFLAENKLAASVELLESTQFEKSLLEFCKSVNADLLAATYYEETFHLFSSNLVQALAENELGLPIMTLNGEETSQATAFGFITV